MSGKRSPNKAHKYKSSRWFMVIRGGSLFLNVDYRECPGPEVLLEAQWARCHLLCWQMWMFVSRLQSLIYRSRAFLGRAMLLTADRLNECLLFNRKWSNFYLESKARIWEAEGGICLVCVEAVGTNMYLKVCLFMFHDSSLCAGSHWYYRGLVSGDSTYFHMKAD